MTSKPVSGITSDDPDVTRILAEMAAPPTGGPAHPTPTGPPTGGPPTGGPAGRPAGGPAPDAAASTGWPAPATWPEPEPEPQPEPQPASESEPSRWPAPATWPGPDPELVPRAGNAAGAPNETPADVRPDAREWPAPPPAWTRAATPPGPPPEPRSRPEPQSRPESQTQFTSQAQTLLKPPPQPAGWGRTDGPAQAWPPPQPRIQPQVVDADGQSTVPGYRLPPGGYPIPAPAAAPDQRTAAATDVVTCPECGQLATVNMARRSADDFCRTCDFPLFWAKGTVIMPEGQETGASLRRLPGTVGRAATAALVCPHCSEPNSPTAQICVRCALSLHPVDIPEPAPAPEPHVVFDPPPAVEAEPEPAPGFDWWWVVAVVMAVIAVALIVALVLLQ